MAFHSEEKTQNVSFSFFFLQVKYKMKKKKKNEKENSLVTGRVTRPSSFFFNTANAKCKYFMKKKKRKFCSLLLFIRYTLLSHTEKS